MKKIMILMMVMSTSLFASECEVNVKDACTKETCADLNPNFSFKDGICKDVQSSESKVTDCSAVSGKQGAKDADAGASGDKSESKVLSK
jgi:hypothetical protein